MSAQPRWVRVEGRNRCERCGAFVDASWCWFANLTTWTRCYCEQCVEQLLEEES